LVGIYIDVRALVLPSLVSFTNSEEPHLLITFLSFASLRFFLPSVPFNNFCRYHHLHSSSFRFCFLFFCLLTYRFLLHDYLFFVYIIVYFHFEFHLEKPRSVITFVLAISFIDVIHLFIGDLLLLLLLLLFFFC